MTLQKEEYILLLLMSITVHLFLSCREKMNDLNISHFEEKIEQQKVIWEQHYQSQIITSIITDIKFIDEYRVCPKGYSILLPYLFCDEVNKGSSPSNQEEDLPIHQSQKENCYQYYSEKYFIYLYKSHEYGNYWDKVKICGKVTNASKFRYNYIQFDTKELFMNQCKYKDIDKIGYISSKNKCSTKSIDQKCLPGQFKYESQFLITCLENKSQQIQLDSFSCKSSEISCMSSQTLYCMKNTESCPISDFSVNNYLDVETVRNDMNKLRFIGFELKDLDTKQVDILKGIEVRKQYSYQNEKIVQKVRKEIYKDNIKQTEAEECLNITKKNVQSYQVIYMLFSIGELIGFAVILKQLSIKTEDHQLRLYTLFKAGFGFILLFYHLLALTSSIKRINKYTQILHDLDPSLYDQIYGWSLTDYVLFYQYVFFIIFIILNKLMVYLK